MAKLIYSAIASADGYTEDAAGGFDWGAPAVLSTSGVPPCYQLARMAPT